MKNISPLEEFPEIQKPVISGKFGVSEGERHEVTVGDTSPEEISKRTPPLGYAFADFSRKRKVSARVGGMSPQNRKFDESYCYASK